MLMCPGDPVFKPVDTQSAILYLLEDSDQMPLVAELSGGGEASRPQSLVLLGQIFEHFERPDLAFTAYSKVLTIHPFLEDVESARDRVASATGEKTL